MEKQGTIKSPEAFRTISEAATDLDVPQHVLRFWESRFSQIKPVKRAGGRRFYRPEDIDLLKGIRALLYVDGLTIRGVQKILKEKGVRHVAAIGRDGAPQAPAPQVVEKIVFVEKTAPPARKRPTHLRAVPSPAPMTLPLFADEVAPARTLETLAAAFAPAAEPVPMSAPGLAREERMRLEALLAELSAYKARFAHLRA